jgi:carbon-monoxide dehydrogenase medium subunit
MEVTSASARRTVAARDFFTGTWTTSMAPDELLTGVSFPVWTGRCGFAVEEFARRHGDFAIAGAAVGVELDEADRVGRCAIALIGLGSTPERAVAAETALVGRAVADIDLDEVGRVATADLGSVPSDLHGSAAYRVRLGAAMVSRALSAAIAEARGG